MFWNKQRKCHICRKRTKEETEQSPRYGIYNDGVWHYHEKCVRETLENPKVSGHAQVDRALVVVDLLKKNKKERDDSVEARRMRVEEAVNANFWGGLATESLNRRLPRPIK